MKRANVATAATVAIVLMGGAAYFAFTLLGTSSTPSVSMAESETPDSVSAQPVGAVQAGTAAEQTESASSETSVSAGTGMIQVTLYVLGSSGVRLTTETHEIPLASSVQSQATDVLRLLLRRSAAIPSGVELRQVFVTSQGVAYVDLSREVVSNHSGGSSAEELTVYGISNTLIANFPAIQAARILVEGSEIQTLAGHLDLTVPYGRAPAYLRPPSENPENLDEAS